MFRLWCEWDLGQENLIFKNVDKARNWLDGAMDEDLRDEFSCAQEIFDAGLAGTIPIVLI